MSTVVDVNTLSPKKLPTHLDLPASDGAIVENFQEHPQVSMLTQSIRPILERLHPEGDYCIGMDSGIYFRITDPPLDGCRAPDWFYVPGVPKQLPDSEYRRSYVLWQEQQSPRLIVEIVSGDGSEERDRTPERGKFWVYEQAIQAEYYAIFDPSEVVLELYELVSGRYEERFEDSRGQYVIEPMGVKLGIWAGRYEGVWMSWVRFYDLEGNLLPHDLERAEAESQRAEQLEQQVQQERQRAEAQKEKAERLAAKLRELGIDPDQV